MTWDEMVAKIDKLIVGEMGKEIALLNKHGATHDEITDHVAWRSSVWMDWKASVLKDFREFVDTGDWPGETVKTADPARKVLKVERL